MTLQLSDGQEFSGYTLLHLILKEDQGETWLALDSSAGERVCLRIFSQPFSQVQLNRINAAITSYRGLVHSSIARTLAAGETKGHGYIVSQYVKGAQPLTGHLPLRSQWPILSQLLDVLEFAHGLGATHGNLHPGNMLMDDQQRLYLTDFGLPPLRRRDGSDTFRSPQINAGQPAEPADDFYAIGAVLHWLLTGSANTDAKAPTNTRPIPAELQHLIDSLSAPAAADRPSRIATLRQVLQDSLDETPHESPRPSAVNPADDRPLQASPFERSSPTEDITGSQTATLTETRSGLPLSTVLVSLAFLLVIAVGVFVLLPMSQGTTPTSTNTAGNDPGTPITDPVPLSGNGTEADPVNRPAPLETARQNKIKADAEAAAEALLRLQIQLEDSGVEAWARQAYARLVDQGLAADDLFRAGQFTAALNQYNATTAGSQALIDSMADVITRNQQAGETALSDGDSQAALDAFKILSAILPQDEAIAAGLRRAKNLEEVQRLVNRAAIAEQAGSLSQALELFSDATELDPNWQPARDGLQRVRASQRQIRFNQRMSDAFAALNQGELDAAEAAFDAAQQILPASSAPADGLLQVNVARQGRSVEQLRNTISQAQAEEEWALAINLYEQVLALDNSLVFARDGLAHARERLDLDETLVRFIVNPELMQADEPLAEAKAALVTAARIGGHSGTDSRLQRQINELSQLISVARIPLPVVITSDNNTRVTVYKVGEFGTLTRQELELYPGRYTVVGKRSGYRDVKQQLLLKGGGRGASVHVVCEERV